MKPMIRSLLIGASVLALVPAVVLAGEAEDQAVKAADEWLALVDQGEYGESWQEAATLFKSAVTVEQWEQALNASRRPLGDLRSRELKGAEYMTSLPGAPDGEYVVIQFDTSFTNKKVAVETVTPMKDEDGIWRVSGYYVK
jgi:hypothetical protein